MKSQRIKTDKLVIEVANYNAQKAIEHVLKREEPLIFLFLRKRTLEESDLKAFKAHFRSKKSLIIPIFDFEFFYLLEDRENSETDFDGDLIDNVRSILA